MYSFGNFQRAELGPQRLPKLADGFEGVLQIVKTWVKDGRRGPMFMCECIVMQSNHPTNPVGQRIMWKQDLTNKNVADNAMFQWAAAVFGIGGENEAGLNWLRASLGDDNSTYPPKPGLLSHAVGNVPQSGMTQEYNLFTHDLQTRQPRYVACRAFQTTTGNNRQFLAHNWAPLQQAS